MDTNLSKQRQPIPVFHSVLGIRQQPPKTIIVASMIGLNDLLDQLRERPLLAPQFADKAAGLIE